MQIIESYFPDISKKQSQQISQLLPIYKKWNEKVNLISRKDIDNIYLHHVLHSLAIAKVVRFKSGTKILDVGTGGGFPGIPLSIFFPDCTFHLIDSIEKKIKAVNGVIDELELTNVKADAIRAEKLNSTYDFVVSRAVTALPNFTMWLHGKINKNNQNTLKNGILYLKGGDFSEELRNTKFNSSKIYSISDFFEEAYFEEKKIVHITL